METLFRRLSWQRAIRKFRRRRPTSPIRRQPLELVRLDDRVAPGSILSAAAAQAVGLGGPLAWVGLTDFDTDPASGSLGLRGTESASPDGPADDARPATVADVAPGAFFSLTSAEVGSARASVADPPVADVPGSPFSPTDADLTPADAPRNAEPIPLANLTAPSGSGGSGSPVADGTSSPHAGGVAVSGGLPAAPAADTAGPTAKASVGASARRVGDANPRRADAPSLAGPPSATPRAQPSGHFAARLQALLHTGDTGGGTFSLSDTANQQTQIGSLIGGQLFGAVGLASGLGSGEPGATATGGLSASHRPASLVGQALNAGSNQSLGLRTSPASSGPFNLVGTQSIGALVSSHGPPGGGLLGGAVAIGRAIPSSNTLPEVGGHPTPAGPDPAVGLPGAVLTPVTPAKGGKGAKATPARNDPVVTPGTFTVYFTLTEQWPDLDSDPTLTEQGTIAFLGLPGGGSEGNGPNYYQTEITALANFGATNYWNLQWEGYADPAGLLYGTDFDQFNQVDFGAPAPSAAMSYVYDSNGDVPFSSSDTSTPAEQNGNTTTQHNYNNSATGDENVAVHVEQDGADTPRAITINDTSNSSFHDRDTGSDNDPATTSDPGYESDTFADTADGTSTETDSLVGTLGSDGTFTLTSFAIDATNDFDFGDSVTGGEGQPEPGGSESDNFTDTDNGHDHEQLHAEGTPDDWTASLDDTSNDGFTDGDAGGENSSQSANGETDTNHDTFHANDGGTDTDQLHLEGHGDASTFTATNVSDTIEDVYHFDDGDGGHSGDATSTENDGDDYTNTDNGHADEKLTVSGDGDSLSATYTDTVHDGYTDSDDEQDGWNDPTRDSTDTGHDHATDGDGGSEDLTLEADASMANWQGSDSDTPGPAPTWQMTSVHGDMTGSADVHAGDDGNDTVAAGPDSAAETFTDTSTGADAFYAHLNGDGNGATLTQGSTFTLHTGSEDDTGDLWADPSSGGPVTGTDRGGELVDITTTDNPVIAVSQTTRIDADGTATPTGSTVDLSTIKADGSLGGTVHETDDGADVIDPIATPPTGGAATVMAAAEAYADLPLGPNQDYDAEQVHDTADLGQGVHVHAVTAGDTTTVGVEQKLNGTIGLNGRDDYGNTLATWDEYTDDATGTLGGTVTGDLNQGGTVANDILTPAASNGTFGLNVGGSCGDTKTEKFDGVTFQQGFPWTPLAYGVGAVVTYSEGGGNKPYTDPAGPPNASYPVFASATPTAQITKKDVINVPTFQLKEQDADANQSWTLGNLSLSQTAVTGTSTVGDYQNCLFPDRFPASGHAEMSDLTTTTVTENTNDSGGLTGSRTVQEVSKFRANGTITPDDDIPDGSTVSETLDLTDTDTVTGSEGAGGPATADLTEKHDVTGNATFTYTLNWNHANTLSGGRDETLTTTTDYHTTKHLDPSQVDRNGNPVESLTAATGSDTYLDHLHFKTNTPDGGSLEQTEDFAGQLAYDFDDENGEVTITPTTNGGSWSQKASSDPTTYSNTNPGPPPGPQDNRDWFAKAADFAAGMGDAVSCGLTQKIRQAAGYDDVVDKNSGYYKGGEIAGTVVAIAAGGANPCGATRLIAGATRTLSAVQGAGQLVNAAEAAKNGDPLGFALNVIGARMSFNKMTAACFAAGTPLYDGWNSAKPIEQFRVGDTVLSRDENDPTGAPALKQVEEVFVSVARVMHLHAGREVIRTTAMHPFWVAGKGWVEADRLQPGDRLGSHDGQSVVVREVYDTGETETVYNLRIADYHTYFVGRPEWGWSAWVHNDCVYIGRAANGRQYVGRTNDFARRSAEHARNGTLIRPVQGLSNLTPYQARAAEQALIEKIGLGSLANKINGIAASNPIYQQAIRLGRSLIP